MRIENAGFLRPRSPFFGLEPPLKRKHGILDARPQGSLFSISRSSNSGSIPHCWALTAPARPDPRRHPDRDAGRARQLCRIQHAKGGWTATVRCATTAWAQRSKVVSKVSSCQARGGPVLHHARFSRYRVWRSTLHFVFLLIEHEQPAIGIDKRERAVPFGPQPNCRPGIGR